jgi:hypothetical protein
MLYLTASVATSSGTIPGLGYLEVVWIVYANLPLRRLASVRTVNPHWGKIIQALY